MGTFLIESETVLDYFTKKYPQRSKKLSAFFRAGEDDRARIISGWLPDCKGLSIYCPGCGDGVFLSGVLRGVPDILRIEDFVPENIEHAAALLKDKSKTFEAAVINIQDSESFRTFDVVLCLGVFDYYSDWFGLLNKLLDNTAGFLIVDFPRSAKLRGLLRRLWLLIHRVSLFSTGVKKLNTLLSTTGCKFEIKKTSFNWMVRITKGPIRENRP